MSDQSCRACAQRLEVVLDLGDVPLANTLPGPDDLGRPDERYPLALAVCSSCSLAQISRSVPPAQLFADYPYFTSYSTTHVESARRIVERLVTERSLNERSLAMEIASNDGYLLRHYVDAGIPVLGVDPAETVADVAEASGVNTIREYFGSELANRLRREGRRPDVLHANNVIAHVPDINDFVRGMSEVLAPDGVVVVETPYVVDIVKCLGFDTIYHEHVFHYSLTSLDRVLRRNGLAPVSVERIPLHGGSLRVFAAHDGRRVPDESVANLLAAEHTDGVGSLDFYRSFAEDIRSLIPRIRAFLDDTAGRGQEVAGYAAAAKATILLNVVGDSSSAIRYVVDANPHKQGRFIPGVRIPIRPPETLQEDAPDIVVILAWNLADEIRDQQRALTDRCVRFALLLPEPRVL